MHATFAADEGEVGLEIGDEGAVNGVADKFGDGGGIFEFFHLSESATICASEKPHERQDQCWTFDVRC